MDRINPNHDKPEPNNHESAKVRRHEKRDKIEAKMIIAKQTGKYLKQNVLLDRGNLDLLTYIRLIISEPQRTKVGGIRICTMVW